MIWFRRVRRNLDACGVASLQSKPRDCVWCFINPVVFLYQPLTIAEELWKGTTPVVTDPLEWKRLKGPALLVWWWFFFVLSNIADQIASSMSKAPKGATDAKRVATLCYATQIADVFNVVAAILAILVVRKLTDRQQAKYREHLSNIHGEFAT